VELLKSHAYTGLWRIFCRVFKFELNCVALYYPVHKQSSLLRDTWYLCYDVQCSALHAEGLRIMLKSNKLNHDKNKSYKNLTKIHHPPYASRLAVLSPVVAPRPSLMSHEPRPRHILLQDPKGSLIWQVEQVHHWMSLPASINILRYR
jgi:hypothetical protein